MYAKNRAIFILIDFLHLFGAPIEHQGAIASLHFILPFLALIATPPYTFVGGDWKVISIHRCTGCMEGIV